jgi:hypothetical protein
MFDVTNLLVSIRCGCPSVNAEATWSNEEYHKVPHKLAMERNRQWWIYFTTFERLSLNVTECYNKRDFDLHSVKVGGGRI